MHYKKEREKRPSYAPLCYWYYTDETHYVEHRMASQPTAHLTLPMMMSRSENAVTTLRLAYTYAAFLFRASISTIQVDTVVRQPQNPSMMPCSTWQPTRPPPTSPVVLNETCCKSYAMPMTAVPKTLTVKVPRGNEGLIID